jgi:hypothetical protein
MTMEVIINFSYPGIGITLLSSTNLIGRYISYNLFLRMEYISGDILFEDFDMQ